VGEREVLGSGGPGTRYVRIWQTGREFRPRQGRADVLEATADATRPQTAAGRVAWGIKRLLMGAPLVTRAAIAAPLPLSRAIGLLGANAVSSTLYATEALLVTLALAGTAAMGLGVPLAIALVALLVIVAFSYRLVVVAYPSYSAFYAPAREHLGDWPGMLTAAALLGDYVLTVAVSVSWGVLSITSLWPALFAVRTALCVLLVIVIALITLRGVRDGRGQFAWPTYVFVASLLGLSVAGWIVSAGRHGPPTSLPIAPASSALGVLLVMRVLRAFAMGSVALTGLETVAHDVNVFQKPRRRNAAIALLVVATTVGVLFLGVTLLAQRYTTVPDATGTVSLTAQLAIAVAGRTSWFVYFFQAISLVVLSVAALTSFANFAQLGFALARDGFAPHQFGVRGDRLTYTTGIVTVTVASVVLLYAFGTHPLTLLPLYALTVLIAFTLSQAGMVGHWWQTRTRGWRGRASMNLLGAGLTGIGALVLALTTWRAGTWVVVAAIPLVAWLCMAIHAHYIGVASQTEPHLEELAPPRGMQHLTIVPVATLNHPTLRALAYACSIAPQVIAVHVAYDAEDAATIQTRWRELVERSELFVTAQPASATGDSAAERAADADTSLHRGSASTIVARKPRLVIIESPYRVVTQPILRYIDIVRRRHPAATITVILPEFVPLHVWQTILHNQSALRLKAALLFRRDLVVTDVPYLPSPRPNEA
jgi:amino acid transporter